MAKSQGHRLLLYGPGGIGKTSLAAKAESPAFCDADDSLPILNLSQSLQVIPGSDWAALRSSLQFDGWDDVNTIVLDSVTKLEEWAVAHTLRTIKTDNGKFADGIEGYGYGKGYQFVFETFLMLLSDLDRHARAGRNIILIAHDCTTPVPNPQGPDWIRYEPRLQSPTSGKASIRLRLREWCDHVLFLGYDVNSEQKKGEKFAKGTGSGTRTLYTSEQPFCMAKSRTTSEQFDIDINSNPWPQIIK